MTLATELLDGSKPEHIARTADLLGQDELVAFPTETVYGLGANGLSPSAVARIFTAKGRPADNPLILHVKGIEDALPLWQASSEQQAKAIQLAAAFWPGPLSLVLPAASSVPTEVTAGMDSVAVRAPAAEVAQELLGKCGFPLAAPSANLSGRPSPTSARHVQLTLGGRIAAILDGGPTRVGIESTVLDLCPKQPRLLRPGAISAEQISAVIGELNLETPPGNAASPGLRHRHYKPSGVEITLADADLIRRQWNTDIGIACSPLLSKEFGSRQGQVWIMPADAAGFAAALYDTLYAIEQSGVARVLIEKPPETSAWTAVNDRLRRASEQTG